MSDIVWHLHRDHFDLGANTVRGVLTGRGREGQPHITLHTVENMARRIPPHEYQCVADFYHGGGYATWEIIWPWDEDQDGRPDRDRLLFHAANAVRNRGGELSLLGCVAPGMTRVENVWETFYPGEPLHDMAKLLPGVGASKKAFNLFAKHNLDVESFVLRVTEVPAPTG